MNALRERELFENRKVSHAVFHLAFPTVIGQIILVIYNMADTFFVGLSGNDAMLAAVTVCMPAFLFLSAISNLFGVGGASAIARALGAREPDRARDASAFAFWGCAAVTALYAAAAYLARDLFVDLLGGTNPEVHENAVAYLLFTVVLGGGITSTGVLLSHLIRAEGRSVHASFGIALGGVLNIGLDPLFMFVLLPPGQEALGAAIRELTRVEQEYLVLFTGYTVSTPQTQSFEVIPVKGTDSYDVFRLSDSEGLLAAEAKGGKPYYMDVIPSKMGAVEGEDAAKASKAQAGIVYRIPSVCSVTLGTGTTPLIDTRIPVYQMGVESLYITK